MLAESSVVVWKKGTVYMYTIPSGKLSHNYGESPFFVGKSTISMTIFNSKRLNYQRVYLPEDLTVYHHFHPILSHLPSGNST